MKIRHIITRSDGLSLELGIERGFRDKDGSLTLEYLESITKRIEKDAHIFEIAMKQFWYNCPMEGKYIIQWSIEKED